MKIGYARTSTLDQVAGVEAQLRDLQQAGCDRVYQEQASAKSMGVACRPQLAAAIDYLRDGDSLVATKLDRLARSIPDLVRIIDQVHDRGAHLRILNLGDTDPASPTGKLLITVLGAIAAFEREMMLERQREGIAKAKAEGKYKGQPAHARAKGSQVLALAAEGRTRPEIAAALEIGERSVYRILAAARAAAPAGAAAADERPEAPRGK